MQTFKCGHPRSPENTSQKGGGYVRCKTCHNRQMHAWRLAHPEEYKAGLRRRYMNRRNRLYLSRPLPPTIERRLQGLAADICVAIDAGENRSLIRRRVFQALTVAYQLYVIGHPADRKFPA